MATTEGRAGRMNLLTSLLTLLAWVFWGCTVFFVDPDVPPASVLFYGAFFVALTCTLARLMGGGTEAGTEWTPAGFGANLGHAAVVSTLLLFALWLQSLGMMTPLNGGFLVVTFFLVEVGFFFSNSSRKTRGRRRLRAVPTSETGLASER